MELKPGYKQTEVGVIPRDWAVRSIGELGNVVRGGSPRPAGDPRYFNGSYIPWLTVAALTNVPEHQLFIRETVGFLTEEGSKHSRKLEDGTLIIANSGATLGVAKILSVTSCANDGIAAISNQRSGDKRFLCHFINSQTKKLREDIATGNGQPNLNTGLIRGIAVPFPPLPEQSAIATALSDVDALLSGLDALIAKKRDLKQAAMSQLLAGKTRLPGFKLKAGAKQTDVGLIPDDWDVSPVGREFDVQLGKMLDAGKNIGELKPYLGNRAVQWNEIDVSDLPLMRMARSDMERFRLRKGDLLVCEGGEVGRAAIWDEPIEECYYQKALHRLRPLRGFDSRLMVEMLHLWSDAGALDNHVTQTSIAHFPREKFLKVLMPVPPLPEQFAIAEVLSDMDAELKALEARRNKTRLLKQGMMQGLLTGKTRLV